MLRKLVNFTDISEVRAAIISGVKQ